MKIAKIATLTTLCLLTLFVLSGCCSYCRMGQQNNAASPCCMKGAAPLAAATAADATARKDILYSCACGPECKCNSASTAPGNCACGKPLAWGHVVKVEGDEALVCTCAEGCACKLDEKNLGQCACGQPLKRVSLKGTGLYFCNCKGSCFCNTVSAVPGECRCGMSLKQVN